MQQDLFIKPEKSKNTSESYKLGHKVSTVITFYLQHLEYLKLTWNSPSLDRFKEFLSRKEIQHSIYHNKNNYVYEVTLHLTLSALAKHHSQIEQFTANTFGLELPKYEWFF